MALLCVLALLMQSLTVEVGGKVWSFSSGSPPTCGQTMEQFVYNGSDIVLSGNPQVISLISPVSPTRSTEVTYVFIPPRTYRFVSGLVPGDRIRFDYCGIAP